MMSGRPALSSEASPPRLLVLDGGAPHEVFDVLGGTGNLVRVRTAFLFEVGEELSVRIEQDGTVSDATARVRGHIGPEDARITELEISGRSTPSGPSGPSGPSIPSGPSGTQRPEST
jgi:hypothetical protein